MMNNIKPQIPKGASKRVIISINRIFQRPAFGKPNCRQSPILQGLLDRIGHHRSRTEPQQGENFVGAVLGTRIPNFKTMEREKD